MSAVNIITQPSTTIQSANNDSIWVVTGSSGYTSSVQDFKYLATVFLSGSRLCMLKSFPDPNYGYGVFNLKGIASNLVTYDFIGDTSDFNTFHTSSNSVAYLQMNFGREFTHSGSFTQSLNDNSTTSFYYVNSSLPYTQQGTFNFSHYVMNGGITGSFFQMKKDSLTNPFKTYNNLRRWLNYYNISYGAYSLNVSTFDNNNTPLNTYHLPNPYSGSEGMQIASVGIPQLSGVDFTNVGYYTVNLENGGFLPVSETIKFQVLQDCSRFSAGAYKVYWLNTLGGFDSWLFNKSNQVTATKTQSNYKKLRGKLNANGSYSLNTYSREVVPYYTELSNKIELSTDFLSNADVLYLKDLFSSPAIYIEDPNGIMTSVTVDTNDYIINQQVNTKIFSLRLTFLSSIIDNRQSL